LYRIQKKYAVTAVLVFGVAVYLGKVSLFGQEKPVRLGATSSGTFTITLKVEPCVRQVVPAEQDETDSLCFSAPGIESLAISCEGNPDSSLVIYPENNRFCLNENDKELIVGNVKQLEGRVTELLLIMPD